MLTATMILNLIALAYGCTLAFRRPGLAVLGTLAALVCPAALVLVVVVVIDASFAIGDRLGEALTADA